MWTTESGCDDMDSFVIDMQPVTGAMGKLTKIYPSCSARYGLYNLNILSIIYVSV